MHGDTEHKHIDSSLCKDHPRNQLSLYCHDCDSYLCTKCLIKYRQTHLTHNLEEINDLHRQASRDLLKSKQVVATKNEFIEAQLAAVKEEMV